MLSGALLWVDSERTIWGTLYMVAVLCFGVWIAWYRYSRGIEPRWTEKQRTAEKQRGEERR